jgi:imidazolonepropionase-like amidohydrolase
MHNPTIVAALLGLPTGLWAMQAEPAARVSAAAPVIALTHVRVIDGTGAAPAEDQTILIERSKISAVGRAGAVRVPAGATVMNLPGHTVIPGFVGLHDHTFYMTSNRATQLNFSAPRLYLASGVTTIRTTGSMSPYQELNLKRFVDEHQVPGPRMYITGPYLNGAGGGGMQLVRDSADARRVVAYWAGEGATWIKAYAQISRAALAAAIDEAHKRGLKVTGHLCSVTFREAVALGIDNLEHGLLTDTDYDPDKKPDECPANSMAQLAHLDLASEPVQATFRDMITHHVAMTSTLAVFEVFVPNRPPLEQRMLDAMAPEVRAEYLKSREHLTDSGAFAVTPDLFKKAEQFEYAFVQAGGLLAAGVDPTGNGGALPGFGDQRNFELLIEAGFTPPQAIEIMTANGAKVLGAFDQFGSITPGKLADLVVIEGDPVSHPSDIRNVRTVFKEGTSYDPTKLLAAVQGLVGIR